MQKSFKNMRTCKYYIVWVLQPNGFLSSDFNFFFNLNVFYRHSMVYQLMKHSLKKSCWKIYNITYNIMPVYNCIHRYPYYKYIKIMHTRKTYNLL